MDTGDKTQDAKTQVIVASYKCDYITRDRDDFRSDFVLKYLPSIDEAIEHCAQLDFRLHRNDTTYDHYFLYPDSFGDANLMKTEDFVTRFSGEIARRLRQLKDKKAERERIETKEKIRQHEIMEREALEARERHEYERLKAKFES